MLLFIVRIGLSIALVSTFCQAVFSQVPDFAKVPNLYEGDTSNITYLISHGVKVSKGKVIAWFPEDSLSEKRMNEIIDTLNAGIGAAEEFIGAPLPWQVHQPGEPYTFYFRYDRFISHASGAGFVSIPFWRIKSSKAPWLHEAVHEMLNTNTGSWQSPLITDEEWQKNMPLWLYEGLADCISLSVCRSKKLVWFDVFSGKPQTNEDSLFIEELKSDKASYILSFIGANGVMPELFSDDRKLYAPAFYHGSASFVSYIANSYNKEVLLTAISSFGNEQQTIEKLTARSTGSLKNEWLEKLGIKK